MRGRGVVGVVGVLLMILLGLAAAYLLINYAITASVRNVARGHQVLLDEEGSLLTFKEGPCEVEVRLRLRNVGGEGAVLVGVLVPGFGVLSLDQPIEPGLVSSVLGVIPAAGKAPLVGKLPVILEFADGTKSTYSVPMTVSPPPTFTVVSPVTTATVTVHTVYYVGPAVTSIVTVNSTSTFTVPANTTLTTYETTVFPYTENKTTSLVVVSTQYVPSSALYTSTTTITYTATEFTVTSVVLIDQTIITTGRVPYILTWYRETRVFFRRPTLYSFVQTTVYNTTYYEDEVLNLFTQSFWTRLENYTATLQHTVAQTTVFVTSTTYTYVYNPTTTVTVGYTVTFTSYLQPGTVTYWNTSLVTVASTATVTGYVAAALTTVTVCRLQPRPSDVVQVTYTGVDLWPRTFNATITWDTATTFGLPNATVTNPGGGSSNNYCTYTVLLGDWRLYSATSAILNGVTTYTLYYEATATKFLVIYTHTGGVGTFKTYAYVTAARAVLITCTWLQGVYSCG